MSSEELSRTGGRGGTHRLWLRASLFSVIRHQWHIVDVPHLVRKGGGGAWFQGQYKKERPKKKLLFTVAANATGLYPSCPVWRMASSAEEVKPLKTGISHLNTPVQWLSRLITINWRRFWIFEGQRPNAGYFECSVEFALS